MPSTTRRRSVVLALVAVAAVGVTVAANASTRTTPAPTTASSRTVDATRTAPTFAADDPRYTTPYSAMWLWENPVHATTDARGRGYAEADPTVVAGFARAQGVSTVHVATPWGSDEGEVAVWLDDITQALQAEAIAVSVLGGDPTWLNDPSLGAEWTRDALRGRDIDRVQLSLEPWTQPLWNVDRARAVAQWQAAMDAVRAELPTGVELGVDAPAWLASVEDETAEPLFAHVLTRADSVAVVAFRDVAEGDDGILALSADARAQSEAAGVPYTIGLETDSPRLTGGPEYTFFDEGAAVLDEQARIVHAALVDAPGYRGVAIERFRTWRDLVDPPAVRYGGRDAGAVSA